MRRRAFITVALVTALAARDASGDIIRVKSASELTTSKGNKLQLPPGYFLDEDTWELKDAEMRRLQETETRLKAENQSLRKSSETGSFPWITVGVVFALGVTAGVFIAK